MPPKRCHTTPFQKTHDLKFGVQPSERTSGSDCLVISAECLFCAHFGCKQKPGYKHARTVNIKYYTSPFRTDNYTQHLKAQHPERWEVIHIINAPIVNTIIGEMLWDPGEIDGQTHAMLMMSLKETNDESKDLGEGQGDGCHHIIIRNCLQYDLAVRYLAASCTFCQCVQILQDTKETTGVASIGSANDLTVAKYA
eukprot:7339341-Ditylum_brightwellii.AAC.1